MMLQNKFRRNPKTGILRNSLPVIHLILCMLLSEYDRDVKEEVVIDATENDDSANNK
jgi:hypothetical protein